jgi:hypothetical protein
MNVASRPLVVWLCLAALLVALAAPGVASDHFTSVLVPLGPVFTSMLVTLIRLRSAASDEQLVSLLSLTASRAPPAQPSLD